MSQQDPILPDKIALGAVNPVLIDIYTPRNTYAWSIIVPSLLIVGCIGYAIPESIHTGEVGSPVLAVALVAFLTIFAVSYKSGLNPRRPNPAFETELSARLTAVFGLMHVVVRGSRVDGVVIASGQVVSGFVVPDDERDSDNWAYWIIPIGISDR